MPPSVPPSEEPKQKTKICHIINALYIGGAEMMLCKLLESLSESAEYELSVITLIDGGPLAEKIEALGIPVRSCGMTQGKFRWKDIKQLKNYIKQENPDLVQTWMYHSDLFGSLATKLVRRSIPVVWNIRHSHLDSKSDKKSTLWTAKILAKLSHYLPRKIIVNSHVGSKIHTELGYEKEKMQVVPNGFDLSKFRPNHADRQAVLKELQLPDSVKLIGNVGRFHPVKGHLDFIKSAEILASESPKNHFVMIGKEIDSSNQELMNAIEQTGYSHRFHLMGARNDLPKWNASFDLLISSALGEGFPNVIGEAMCSAVPCVVTDAGDSRVIVGETGEVVPIGKPELTAQEASVKLNLSSDELWLLGMMARKRIRENFSMESITQQYSQLWSEVLGKTETKVNEQADLPNLKHAA